MSPRSAWRYDREQLAVVLARWRSSSPSDAERRAVAEVLMDVVTSPLTAGRPDPDHAQFWEARIEGTNLVFTYVPDRDTLVIWPWDLSAPVLPD